MTGGIQTEELDMRAAALWYARQRIPVFPCKPRCKEPLTPHGFKDATLDERQIEEWWSRWQDGNIGIPTGRPSGLLVIDIDPRNGGPEDRDELVRLVGQIPDTAEVLTGGGGRHIYFRYGGTTVPKALAPGIDLKGDGGYVIAPPSIHPNGKRYEVDGLAGAKAFLNIAEAPAWSLERIAAAQNGQHRAETIEDSQKWPAGERNTKLASIAGTMRRRGLSREAIEAALLEENKRRCDPPLAEEEVRAIAASVARYDPAVSSPGDKPKPLEPAGPKWSIRDIPSVWSLEARVTWIVPDILMEGGVTLLTGDSGAGKSWLTLALCSAVARGETFLGRACQRRPVLYVDRENPLAVVRFRLDEMHIAETPDLIVWGAWNDPAPDTPTAPSLLQFARDECPLIVFDSLVAFHPGSEQDASETRRHMQAYRSLAARGATVVVLHHTGKSEGPRDYRGSALIAREAGTVPPLEAWPESLNELAAERGRQTGDPDASREEIWVSWCEWKARGLNRLFEEHGNIGPGRIPPGITADTVQDGCEKAMRRGKR